MVSAEAQLCCLLYIHTRGDKLQTYAMWLPANDWKVNQRIYVNGMPHRFRRAFQENMSVASLLFCVVRLQSLQHTNQECVFFLAPCLATKRETRPNKQTKHEKNLGCFVLVIPLIKNSHITFSPHQNRPWPRLRTCISASPRHCPLFSPCCAVPLRSINNTPFIRKHFVSVHYARSNSLTTLTSLKFYIAYHHHHSIHSSLAICDSTGFPSSSISFFSPSRKRVLRTVLRKLAKQALESSTVVYVYVEERWT